MIELDLTINKNPVINVTIGKTSQNINVALGLGGSKVPKYDGKYDITPTIDGETLNTENKLMEKNVNIRPIPFYEVSNASQGETIYIAKEI